MIINEYYGIAMQLSDYGDSMHCAIQKGTGNTVETSNLVSVWYPYSPMRSVITNIINEDGYVSPEQFFKVKVIEAKNSISYEFFPQEETQELIDLFKIPDYFENIDTSFLDE